jgi:hypothetical protein
MVNDWRKIHDIRILSKSYFKAMELLNTLANEVEKYHPLAT